MVNTPFPVHRHRHVSQGTQTTKWQWATNHEWLGHYETLCISGGKQKYSVHLYILHNTFTIILNTHCVWKASTPDPSSLPKPSSTSIESSCGLLLLLLHLHLFTHSSGSKLPKNILSYTHCECIEAATATTITYKHLCHYLVPTIPTSLPVTCHRQEFHPGVADQSTR